MTDPSKSNGPRETESHRGIQSLKDHTAQQLKEVQTHFAEKEKQLTGIFKHPVNQEYYDDLHQNVAAEYEDILKENVAKLQGIAREDFDNCNRDNQKIVQETKAKIHDFIHKTFQDHASKKDFTRTAEAIFENVNKKVKDDLKSKTKSSTKTVERTRNSLMPDNINFAIKKSPEEVEAEQGLQKYFEEELLQFNEQIKEDFGNIREKMLEDVDKTRNKLKETMENVAQSELPKVGFAGPDVPEGHTPLNFPSKTTVEKNMNDLLTHTQNEFKKVNENMQMEVEKTKEEINEKTKYCYEIGKNLLNFRNDNDDLEHH